MCADPEGKKADIPAATPADRGETIGLMEPLLIGESSPRRGEVTDLAVDLAASPLASAAACRRACSPRSPISCAR